MANLEELGIGVHVDGLAETGTCEIIDAEMWGSDLRVVFVDARDRVGSATLTTADASRLTVVEGPPPTRTIRHRSWRALGDDQLVWIRRRPRFGGPPDSDVEWPWNDPWAIALARAAHLDYQGHDGISMERFVAFLLADPCPECGGYQPATCQRCHVVARVLNAEARRGARWPPRSAV